MVPTPPVSQNCRFIIPLAMRASDTFLSRENLASHLSSRHNGGRIHHGPAGAGQDHD